jgi:hypothetical protein
MICDSCKVDRLVSDFINNQKFCYQCMYRIKMGNTVEKQIPKPSYCRTCGSEIIQKENEKKRQRTIFCSCDCAERGHKEQVNNHWTRKVGSEHACKITGEFKWNTDQQ